MSDKWNGSTQNVRQKARMAMLPYPWAWVNFKRRIPCMGFQNSCPHNRIGWWAQGIVNNNVQPKASKRLERPTSSYTANVNVYELQTPQISRKRALCSQMESARCMSICRCQFGHIELGTAAQLPTVHQLMPLTCELCHKQMARVLSLQIGGFPISMRWRSFLFAARAMLFVRNLFIRWNNSVAYIQCRCSHKAGINYTMCRMDCQRNLPAFHMIAGHFAEFYVSAVFMAWLDTAFIGVGCRLLSEQLRQAGSPEPRLPAAYSPVDWNAKLAPESVRQFAGSFFAVQWTITNGTDHTHHVIIFTISESHKFLLNAHAFPWRRFNWI